MFCCSCDSMNALKTGTSGVAGIHLWSVAPGNPFRIGRVFLSYVGPFPCSSMHLGAVFRSTASSIMAKMKRKKHIRKRSTPICQQNPYSPTDLSDHCPVNFTADCYCSGMADWPIYSTFGAGNQMLIRRTHISISV